MKISQKYLLISVFLVTFLFNLKTALAEIPSEIKIGQVFYPSIILIPIAIIFIAIIILIFYLFLHSLAISRLNQKEKPRKIKKIKKIDKKVIETKPEKNEKPPVDKRKILENCLILLSSLKKSQKRLSTIQSINKFSLLIRKFFKEFFEIEYEFTFDELEKELIRRKQKSGILEFIRKLEFQYDPEMPNEQLSGLITEFEEILNDYALIGVKKISEILKEEKKVINDVLVKGLDGSYNEKNKKVIELIKEWENSPEKKQEEVFDRIYLVLGSMTRSERKIFLKKIYDAYEKYNSQVCPNTLSCESASNFKKQLDDLKDKLERKVFAMEE